MKKITILFAFMLGLMAINAQNASDILRYSTRQPLGSARYVGVGGSMGAIGADFGAISDNPAGLASYYFSEIVISPSLYLNHTSSQLGDAPFSKENLYGGALDNLGVVIVRNGRTGGNWRTSNFSIGLNKVADFNNQLFFNGGSTGSITDHWREQALHVAPDDLSDFSSGLAYETGAIFDLDNDNVYESDFISAANQLVTKSQLVKAKGYMSELQFAIAGNYKDRLLLGASLGVPIVYFEENKTYEEADPNQVIPAFERLKYTEYLKTKGTGINLKLGAILKLHDMFRIGLSFQTPSLIELDETYETGLSYSYTDQGKTETYENQSPQTGVFTYNVISPLRARASFGSVIGKAGFVGASVEYVNYSQSQFDFNNQTSTTSDLEYQNQLNDDIEKQYGSALNYNLGAEIAVEALRLRGGINLMGSPYSNERDYTSTYSAGLGYRGGRFFTDVAIRHSRYDDGYLPYTTYSNDPQVVYNKHQLNRLVLTLGYKF